MSAPNDHTDVAQVGVAQAASRPALPLRDALRALRAVRRSTDIVITTMGSAREWMAMGLSPLDFVYVPSSMSHATSLGLGLALARPDLRVIVCNGDGSMLMNLGSLVSITAAAPANLTTIVFDNGIYEVTGAQPTPATRERRGDGQQVDFEMLARGSGFQSVFRFDDLVTWQRDVGAVLDSAGPTFVALDIAPVPGAPGPRSPGPAGERARKFMEAVHAARA
jgi:sulfopyruvate decarboxylase subunit beta